MLLETIAMASCKNAWRRITFINFLSLCVCTNTASTDFLPQVNASSVKLGFIWEHPRYENHDAHEAVMTTKDKTLRLVCVISPPLPQTNVYMDHRDELVMWKKVTPVARKPHSLQFWSASNSRTALSFPNITLDVLGTYSCSYGKITKSIDVLVADAKAAEHLEKPKCLEEFEEYVVYRKDKSDFKSWKTNLDVSNFKTVGVPDQFHCQLGKSKEKPKSVHQLRPSDISVVAAIGDSLTTGLGAKATSLNGYFTQFRGMSWSIGGDNNLNITATLPNILKLFNPALKGFSVETDVQSSKTSDLNIATTNSKAEDLMTQAKELFRRMKEQQSFSYKDEWKLLTIWIGTADLCKICDDKVQFSPRFYIKYVMRTLGYLHKEVPKMFVNLVLPMDVSKLYDIMSNQECTLEGWNACGCVHSSEETRKNIADAAKEYTRLLKELVNSGLYDTRQDFTVAVQPFMQSPPKSENGDIVRDVFGQDCFHFSSKGHAAAAVALWNNMFEIDGVKAEIWSGSESLVCPSELQPYLATRHNSNTVSSVSEDSVSESASVEMPPVAAIVLSVFLTVVVISVVIYMFRSRRSRAKPDTLKLIGPHPFRPKI